MPSFHTYSCMLHSYGALLVSQGRVIIISWAIDDTMPSTLARYAHTCIGHEHISPARNPYWSGFSSSHRDRWISCSTSSKITFSHFCIIARARCGWISGDHGLGPTTHGVKRSPIRMCSVDRWARGRERSRVGGTVTVEVHSIDLKLFGFFASLLRSHKMEWDYW